MNRDEKHASDSILARLGEGRTELNYQRDQIVYSQGDPADFVFYVATGTLKVSVVSEAGKGAVVAILRPAHFCGEDCLAGHKLRMATVTALTDCVLLRMTKASITPGILQDGAVA